MPLSANAPQPTTVESLPPRSTTARGVLANHIWYMDTNHMMLKLSAIVAPAVMVSRYFAAWPKRDGTSLFLERRIVCGQIRRILVVELAGESLHERIGPLARFVVLYRLNEQTFRHACQGGVGRDSLTVCPVAPDTD